MRTHEQTVHDQFDPKAEAYLHSTVHAQGPDLAHAAGLVGRAIPPSGTALDVGCGAGHLSFALASRLERVVAVDPSARMLETVATAAAVRGLQQIETHQAGAESLPFCDSAFDLVGTRFSAHHWRSVESGIHEMRRVLAPRGYLLVIDVLGHEDPLVDTHLQTMELLRDPSHVRNRSACEWRKFLAAAGFEDVQEMQWSLRLDFQSWIERMRTPPLQASTIRELQRSAAREVQEMLAFEADGSFSVRTGLFWARRPAAPPAPARSALG